MLENKKISIKDYYEIQNKRFNWGKEGTVTEINNNVIKLFYPDFGNKVISKKEIELIAQNKFNKLKYLSSTPEFTNYLKPLFTCTINDKFVGYGYKKINCNTFDEEPLHPRINNHNRYDTKHRDCHSDTLRWYIIRAGS